MQQSLDRPRPQQQRTMTLGPGAPIHDWEVERVTILAEHKEYRERAERLEKQIQQDRETYERNTASLLREVKMKEGLWEKRVQDIERNMMQEIEMLQRQLEKQRLEYTEELQEARKRHDDALDTEQKKHERRLAALQERLNAKDAELAQLKTDGALQEDDNPKYQKEIAEWKSRCEAQQKEIDELKKSLEEKPQITDERIIQLETQLQTVEQGHKAKLQNMVENHESEMQRMRELFMNENHQIAMQHEARLDNMRSDYEAILAETREQFEAEKEVWQIERQTAVDQALRKAQLSHEDAIKELERTWNNKLQDMQASMSKDASDIQKHWQGKLDEADAAFKTQLTRLKGEIEVVKDRLGQEIDRRRRLQEREKYAQEKAAKLETEVKQLQRQLYNTQEDYRAAYKLAQHLMSLSSVDNIASKSCHDQLPELLQCCLRNVSILLSEKTMDTMTELRYF